jgi:hypothetical protein
VPYPTYPAMLFTFDSGIPNRSAGMAWMRSPFEVCEVGAVLSDPTCQGSKISYLSPLSSPGVIWRWRLCVLIIRLIRLDP